MQATFSGICPMCSRFIAKGRSKIVKLPEAIVPRGDGWFSFDDGHAYYADGRMISMYPREWVHEKCRPRYGQPTKYVASRNAELGFGPVPRGSQDAA